MRTRLDQEQEHTRLQPIAAASCRDLLSRHTYGRIAWQAAHGLQILPVSYAWHDERIVFRTSPEGSLSELVRPCDVVFEVDELDEAKRSGWSVVVHGRAQAVAGLAELAHLWTIDGAVPWAGGLRNLFIAITPDRITGRTITHES